MEIRDKNHNLHFPTLTPIIGRRPIVPGSSWMFRFDLDDISDDELTLLREKKKALFVWGRAEYMDVFGDYQSIDFRYQNVAIVFESVEGVNHFIGWALYPEEYGNDAT